MSCVNLTPKQSRRINSLIRKECCNYDGNGCILLGGVCPQLITYSHIICKWFKIAVLPLDKALYIELTKPPNTKKCAVCGKYYVYKGNKSKYCPDCKRTVLRRQKASYQRKKRYQSGTIEY